jgi:type II secretory ATPase GspE/PulE/Tfp pilus assembly ATPase PilB-like protein
LIAGATHPRSIITLEDPVEARIPGAAQSQVNPAAGYNLAEGLRTLVRQDPEVLAIGEIRDPATAAIAVQAALTGHLVLTTFHAGSASGALARLLDMNIEPYALRSALRAIIAQRLLRRICSCANRAGQLDSAAAAAAASPEHAVQSSGPPDVCPLCRGTSYHGRILIAEALPAEHSAVAQAILQRADAQAIERIAVQSGMLPLAKHAEIAVSQGLTTSLEVARVLGLDAITADPGLAGPAS